jgi:Ca2+-binding EF-hand superfamily protein
MFGALRVPLRRYNFRSGSSFITYDDLVAFGEETGGEMEFRYAVAALEIVDIDGDGKIGLLDFIHFAARLKAAHEVLSICGINDDLSSRPFLLVLQEIAEVVDH